MSINKSKKTIEREQLKKWRLLVLERDNSVDQITGEKLIGRNCQVHHVLDKKNFPHLKFDINNGLTLSYRNHKVGKLSPHMNALLFAKFFMNNFPDRYKYLMKRINIVH